MCGIAGIINCNGHPVCEETLNRMNTAMFHRGPDEDGMLIAGGVGLAQRRLSIIDLAKGRQPISNEDDSIHIIYNGEVYNSPELRARLLKNGHIFKTDTDTEVILHLYEELKHDCVKYLNGMFAFAILDTRLDSVFIARDRMGQKPLLYFRNKDSFVFASELTALRQHPDMPREIDPQSIHDYFSLQYIPAPATAFKDVFKLPPGHFAEVNTSSGHVKISQYWKVDFTSKISLDFNSCCEMLRELLEDSVRKRLLADVPVGAFLSGGIDSSIIAALMAKTADAPVNTFTIGFDDPRYDERAFARDAVSHINALAASRQRLNHHEKTVNQNDFNILVKLIRQHGEPFSDASMLPSSLLSEFTRQHVKVALSGDGADELFGGYYRYTLMRFMRKADLIPIRLRAPFLKTFATMLPSKTDERTATGRLARILRIAAARSNERYLSIINRFDENSKHSVCGDIFRSSALSSTQEFMDMMLDTANATDPVDRIMELDINSYLPGDILCKVDTASMANSLEVRNPFMDHRLVEFSARLPLHYKQRGWKRKYILSECFRDLIPDSVRQRPKAGFGVPLASWFRKRWDGVLREHLLEGRAVEEGFLRKEQLANMIREHQTLKADHSYPLFSLLIFELFLEECR